MEKYINKVIQGDCLEVMRQIPENSVDAIVTDPPYGLSFMGKHWDYDVPSQAIWEECLRVLKPGGYLLAFAGTRTQHRMAVRIEDAGFEIRDMIAWVYGSGFPKSLNIGKAVDKLQGNERVEMIDPRWEEKYPNGNGGNHNRGAIYGAAESVLGTKLTTTKGNSKWEGWGTALKPALEPITVARKPLSEKNVAENVLKWGTGGINIDESRVSFSEDDDERIGKGYTFKSTATITPGIKKDNSIGEEVDQYHTQGRFPANLIHDGSEEVVELFPSARSSGNYKKGSKGIGDKNGPASIKIDGLTSSSYADQGSASRFFYCAKASKSERNRGCEELPEGQTTGGGGMYNEEAAGKYGSIKAKANNFHPTVKPIALMEYLVKLVSREGAIVLDPFAGSGSTLIACKNLGRNYIGIEREEDYIKICEARLVVNQPQLL